MRKLKLFSACLITIAMLVVLVACANGNQAAQDATPAPAQDATQPEPAPGAEPEAVPEVLPGELPRLVMSRWGGPHADDQRAVIAAWPYADVIIDDIDFGNLQMRQIQSMSVSAEYDLIWVPEFWFAEYARNGWLLPLDDFVANSDFNLGDYSASMVDMNRLNGTLYALPSFAQTLILTVNTEWFEREGQSIPTTPEEMVAVARHFHEQGTGIAIPASQGQAAADLFSTILFSAGGSFFDANGNINLISEEAIYAATIWDQLVGYSMPGSTMWHHDDVSAAVRTEAAPFGTTVSGLSMLDMDPQESLIIDTVAYFTIPARGDLVGVASTWSWGIAANSANPQAAFDFLTWLVGPEADKAQALRNAQVSALSAIAEDPEVLAAFPHIRAASAQLANSRVLPNNPGAVELMPALQVALSELAVTNRTPLEVFTELHESLQGVVTED